MLELVLAHGHRAVVALAPAWAAFDLDRGTVGEIAEPVVAEAEVAVVADMLTGDEVNSLPEACSHPRCAADGFGVADSY